MKRALICLSLAFALLLFPAFARAQGQSTPIDCSGVITAGGTAQNAYEVSGTLLGWTLANIDTSEVLWWSITGTAAAGGLGSFPLPPATATTFAGIAHFTTPFGLQNRTALSVVAATTNHKFSCMRW